MVRNILIRKISLMGHSTNGTRTLLAPVLHLLFGITVSQMTECRIRIFRTDVRNFVSGSSAPIARSGIKNMMSAMMMSHIALIKWTSFSSLTNCIRQVERVIVKSGNVGRKESNKWD